MQPDRAGVSQRHSRTCIGAPCDCPWRASVYSKWDGKKIRKTFATLPEAVAWRSEATTAAREGSLRALTVADAAEGWLYRIKSGTDLARGRTRYAWSTIASYEHAFRNYVLPTFGTKMVRSVTHHAVQDFIDGLTQTGMNPHTVATIATSMRVFFRASLQRGLAHANPMWDVVLPPVPKVIREAAPQTAISTGAIGGRPDELYAGDRRLLAAIEKAYEGASSPHERAVLREAQSHAYEIEDLLKQIT